ncbi:hypothetical protein [Herpetosiphon giganteus]|uniref:hypothetical protein n=1 Tax=Herpetosiphon giganteus TaxID=2029754 RepID=UPI00195A2EB5|nr:hypothetical protein [Herpetosiphon giganteus]MBM7841542.1 hypothetical protein [Herpetosiphon giganteus]
MRQYLDRYVMPLWQTYSSPGQPLRPTNTRALHTIYGIWLFAFVLKLMGSGWDVAWHFRFLRDDLAPPHMINTVGTVIVVLLVMFHTWTGYGVDRLTLRLMQAGISIFLIAIPLDLINHRLFGLDITSWSPTHALLYLGTAVMLLGVLRGWLLLAPDSRIKTVFGIGFWAFLLEDFLFPLGQQEYGVTAIEAMRLGKPYADAELMIEAGANPERFAIPVPDWLYPLWLITSVVLVLLAARLIMRGRWTATLVAGTYLLYRVVSFYILRGIEFPPSFVPLFIIGTALAIDIGITYRINPFVAAFGTLMMFYAGAWISDRYTLMPEIPYTTTMPIAAILLGIVWAGALWIERSPYVERWRKLA